MPAWYNVGTLNLASLLLGLAAWILPLVAAARPARGRRCMAASFICCLLALVGQILSLGQRVFQGDFSGLVDTMGAEITAALVLVAVTLVLNLFAWVMVRKLGDAPASPER